MRFLEDFEPGQIFELGAFEVTAEEIVEFGSRYDPQPFHVDPEAARESPFGGLVACGWQSAALLGRMFVDEILLDSSAVGSRGFDELRFTAPVRPGDRISGRSEVISVAPSKRYEWRGTVVFRTAGTNQDGEPALHWLAPTMFRRRGAGEAPG